VIRRPQKSSNEYLVIAVLNRLPHELCIDNITEVKLPNGDRAVVDMEKLSGYCLNPQHPRGRNKARVFAAIGIREEDARELRTALLTAAREGYAELLGETPYGARYIVDFALDRAGNNVVVRSAWIVDAGTETPRLITCYVL
jgi:hypothetical protein